METQRKVRLFSYKTGDQITDLDQLPLQLDERTSTDVFCTIITSVFAITMFVIALFCIDMQALQKMTYPTDSEGRHCTLDNKYFNYVYFPTPTNPNRRLCVSTCPVGTEDKLQCWPTKQISCSANSNPQFQVKIYSTQPRSTSMGLFCLPKDETIRQSILNKEHLRSMFNFASNYASIGISLISGLGLAILAVTLFYFLPTIASYGSILLGGLGCFVLAIVLLVSKQDVLIIYKSVVIVFSLALIAVGLFLFWGLIFRRKDIDLSIRYVSQASDCLKAAPWLLVLSFVYIVLLVGLIALCTFQILAYWSSSQMKLTSDSLYAKPHSNFAIWMTVLTVFQFFWGLCFLKQSLNFIVSGVTISWFFTDHFSVLFPITILFKFHWGSVAGAAFLLNILYPLDIIYDLVKPSKLQNRSVLCKYLCCCQCLLDLARSQVMAMVCILGIPYCNSARLCQQVVYHSNYTDGAESANRFVRIGCHILFAGFATVVGQIYTQSKGQTSEIAVILCFIMNLFMLTFFVCLIKDIAQTILFCDLVSNCIENKDQIHPPQKQVSKKLFGEGYQIVRTSHTK